MTLPDISSHAVRDAVSEGRWSEVEGCVAHDVVAYIRERGLYVSDRRSSADRMEASAVGSTPRSSAMLSIRRWTCS